MLLQEYWNRMGGYLCITMASFISAEERSVPQNCLQRFTMSGWGEMTSLKAIATPTRTETRELLVTLLTWETVPSNKQAWAKLRLYGPSLEEKWIPFTRGCCMPSAKDSKRDQVVFLLLNPLHPMMFLYQVGLILTH